MTKVGVPEQPLFLFVFIVNLLVMLFSTGKSPDRHKRGQVAIFMVILFHLFFIFFAMVINVGILVHHKINLQNSVDLAAYYGGMKQAEVLNAIAHVNYQMRQSWKLFTFRYRIYGMAGNQDNQNNVPNIPFYCGKEYPQSCVLEGSLMTVPTNDLNFPFNPRCVTSFCVNYQGWEHMIPRNPSESPNYCRMDCLRGSRITKAAIPNLPSFSRGLFAINLPTVARSILVLSQVAQNDQVRECLRASMTSWQTLAAIYLGYRLDMLNRKSLIMGLAQELSRTESDFLDIEGESARQGALETLKKNLTVPNLEGFSEQANFRFFNSLGHPNCRWNGNQYASPQWLKPIWVRPFLRFVDSDCAAANPNQPITNRYYYLHDVLLENNPSQIPNYNNYRQMEIFDVFRYFGVEPADYTDPQSSFWASTVGFEKNPWCAAYVMVEAETTPKVPFSPLGSITLKARAVAKPFGGRIGPWYARVWPRGQEISGGTSTPLAARTDLALSFRAGNELVGLAEQLDSRLASNSAAADPSLIGELELLVPSYGRFVGDTSGLRARNAFLALTNAFYAQSLVNLNQRFQSGYFLGSYNGYFRAGSILAMDERLNHVEHIKQLEINAILPDQFDITHYSFDLNFFDTYVPRLRKNATLLQKMDALIFVSDPQIAVRGDIGYNSLAQGISRRYSIKHQIQEAQLNPVINRSGPIRLGANRGIIVIPHLGYYVTTGAQQVFPNLTFWHVSTPGDYVLNSNIFGRCLSVVNPAQLNQNPDLEATPNDCIAGGRSGYSVKLVDIDFLTQPQDLGGSGEGVILNPPPQ
ncbi:MAG: pilus assembly protein TadG-related protein [Bdellovibrionaceae bacterium]|nr:pilus assembly protein TadG-related protein [Pseudobdellovibrionaceae bacterium]MDW8189699.1 pilus assembly protein TadG-related protein [Pseudobdellovibrionaceae bacterium]